MRSNLPRPPYLNDAKPSCLVNGLQDSRPGVTGRLERKYAPFFRLDPSTQTRRPRALVEKSAESVRITLAPALSPTSPRDGGASARTCARRPGPGPLAGWQPGRGSLRIPGSPPRPSRSRPRRSAALWRTRAAHPAPRPPQAQTPRASRLRTHRHRAGRPGRPRECRSAAGRPPHAAARLPRRGRGRR